MQSSYYKISNIKQKDLTKVRNVSDLCIRKNVNIFAVVPVTILKLIFTQ